MPRDEKNYWTRVATRRLSRRRVLAAGGVGSAALALGIACGDDDDDDGAATATPGGGNTPGAETPTPVPTSAPKQGGTLKLGGRSQPIWQNAPYSASSSYLELFNAVNETMFRFTSASLDFEPRLAEGYEFNGDESEITVKLKPNLTFHDGTPITADAALASFQSLNAQGTPTSQVRGPAAQYVDSVSAPDASTLLFKLKRPGDLIFDVFHYWSVIEADSVVNATEGKPWNGAGPFALTNIRPQQGATLQAHKGHFAPPYLDSVEYIVFSDPASLAVAVEAGDVDLTKDLAADDIERFKKSNDYKSYVDAGLQAHYCIGMNFNGDVTKDRRVRQALYRSIDRQRIAEDVFLGISKPMNSLWPAGSPAFESRYETDPFDLAEAKTLLEAAGYGSGTPSIEFMCASNNFEGQRIFEILQADAKTIGLNLELQLEDSASFTEQFQKATYPGMYTATFGFNALHPDTLFVMNFQVRIPNSAGFDTPEYQDLQAKFAAAKSSQERSGLYNDFNAMWDEQMWVNLVADRRIQWIGGKNVGNFTVTDWGIPLLNESTEA